MSEKKKVPVCSHCGSEDVLGDTYAVWNKKKGRWELQDEVYEKGAYCNACEGETSIAWKEEA